MSLLWPNQLLVVISHDHVAVHYRTGYTQRMLHQHATQVTEGGWPTALAQLHTYIAQWQVAHGSQLHISIGSDLVRYLALPAQQVFMQTADKLAYARAAYLEMYGSIVSDWHISCDDAPPNQPIIAAAIDTSLHESIVELASQHHLHLAALQPYAAYVFNHASVNLAKHHVLLAIVEQQRIVLMQVIQGACQQIRSHKIVTDWQQNLQDILARARLLDEQATQEVFVYAPLHQGAMPTTFKAWPLKKGARHQAMLTPLHAPQAMLEAML